MPWALMPMILLLSLSFKVGKETIYISYILLPLAVALGLRYGERGLIALFIGAFPTSIVDIIGNMPIPIGGDIHNYILSLFMCGITIQKADFFRPNIQEGDQPIDVNLGPVWILIFLPLMLMSQTLVPGAEIRIPLGLYGLLNIYLYLRGLTLKDSPKKITALLGIMFLVSFGLFFKNGGRCYLGDAGDAIVLYNYFDFSDFITAILYFYIGRYHAKVKLNRDIITKYSIAIIVITLITAHLNLTLKYQGVDNSVAFHVTLPIYIISLYTGLRLQWIGVIITSFFSILFFKLVLPLNNFIPFSSEHIKFYVSDSVSTAIVSIVFSICGVLAINYIKDVSLVKEDINEVLSKSATKLLTIHRLLVILLPLTIILIPVIRSTTLTSSEMGSTSTSEMGSLASLIIESRGYSAAILICFVLGTMYLLTHYFPISLVNEVVKRNGIAFNRNNFPQYQMIHEKIEQIFGEEYFPIYIVSESSIVRWKFAERVYKIFELTNPVILTTTLAGVKDDDKQLLFIIYRQLAKVYLRHRQLWWYTYPFTFLVPINLLYFYARRLTIHQANLFALKKINDFHIAAAALTSEACENPMNVVPKGPKKSLFGGFLTSILEIFSTRPHLLNQLHFLKQVVENDEDIELEEIKYGFKISLR